MKIAPKHINLLILTTLVSLSAYAAPAGGPPPPPTPPPPGLPINEGVLYLFAAALAYGVYFIGKKRKVQNS